MEIWWIQKIAYLKWGGNTCPTRLTFHPHGSCMSKSFTLLTFEMGLTKFSKVRLSGIQPSSHAFIYPHSCYHPLCATYILVIIEAFLSSCLTTHRRNMCLALLCESGFLGKYLASYNLYRREDLFWEIHHPCFPKRARLKAFKSLKPCLPSIFDLHDSFQLTQWIFCFAFFWPYQNFLIKFSSSIIRLFRSKKQLIFYVGITNAIAFKRTSLPPWDRSCFSFQYWSFYQTFVLISPNARFLDLLWRAYRPRYFSWSVLSVVPHNAQIYSYVPLGTFLLKDIEFFS